MNNNNQRETAESETNGFTINEIKEEFRETQKELLSLAMELDERVEQRTNQLLSAEKKYREIFENAIEGIFRMTPDGLFITANPSMARILGYDSPDELIGEAKDFKSQLCLASDCDDKIFTQMEKNGSVSGLEVQAKRKDGQVIWLRINAKCIRDKTGEKRYCEGFVEDITQHKKARDEIKKAYDFLDSIINALDDPLFVKDREHRWVILNDSMCEMMRSPREELIGKSDYDIFPVNEADIFWKYDEQVFNSGETNVNEESITVNDKLRTISTKKTRFTDKTEDKEYLAGSIRDITPLVNLQKRQELALSILELLNTSGGKEEIIGKILELVKEFLKIEAIGIRLGEDDDFPYFINKGFSDEFIETEKYLCARDESLKIIRDSEGNSVLECMCGNILRGRTNPDLEFFTQGGSFWSNSTTKLLATTNEKDRQARTRNRCNGEGYESVALIPLKSNDEIIGLLQLNDRRQGCFTLDLIEFFEKLGTSIGIALGRIHAEESIKKSEKKFKDLFNSSPDAILIYDFGGNFIEVNEVACNLLGYTREDFLSMSPWNIEAPEFAKISEAKIYELLEKEKITFESAYVHKNGKQIPLEIRARIVEYEKWDAMLITARDITERKQAEEEIANLAKFPDENPNPVMRINRDGTLTYNNRAAEELIQAMEFTEGKQPGDKWLSLVHKVLEFGKPRRSEIEIGDRILSLTFAPIVHSGYVNIYGYDITSRKKAEKSLREQKKLLDNTLSHIPNFVFWKDINSVYLGCNNNFAEAAGLENADEIKGKTDYDLPWTKDETEFYRKIDRIVMDTGTPILNLEESQTTAGGKMPVILTSKVPLRDDEDNVMGILGIYSDITELKQAQKAVVESELMFRNIFEKSPIAIAVFNLEEKLTRINEAFKTLFSITDIKDFEENNFFEVADIPQEQMEEIKKGKSVRYETKFDFEKVKELKLYRTEKAGKINIIVLVTPLRNEETEEFNGYLVQIQDITEHLNMEKQLAQSQKMEAIGRLAGGIAHDFNNLLTGIKGSAELARMEASLPEPLKELIDEITGISERAATLIQQLLSFSKKQMIAPMVIDVNESIKEMEKMLHRVIPEDITLQTKLSSDPLRIKIDPGQFDQIIMNLVVNARDAMPQGGKIIIETSLQEIDESYKQKYPTFTNGEFICLAFTDTGTGMDKETLSKIFEPFFTTKGMVKGTGLGLSTVYGIVNQMNGHIIVYSEPGKGTTFKIYLPPSEEEALVERIRTEAVQRVHTGKETLLLVEDESIIRKLLEKILARAGYRAVITSSGKEALSKLERDKLIPDLLISDLVLPDYNGWDLSLELKKDLPDMRILFMSGYSEDVITEKCTLGESVNFIGKPFGVKDFLDKIRDVLDR